MTAVLIVSALVVVLGISAFHASSVERSMSSSYESSQDARMLAEACVNEGVSRLKDDIDYSGLGSVGIGGMVCDTLQVEDVDDNRKLVSALARAGERDHFYSSEADVRYIKEFTGSDWEDGEDISGLGIYGNLLSLEMEELYAGNLIPLMEDGDEMETEEAEIDYTEESCSDWLGGSSLENLFCSGDDLLAGSTVGEAGVVTVPASAGWESVELSRSYGEPVFFANSNTENEEESPKVGEVRNTESDSFDVRVCEHEDGYGCDTHVEEDAGWMVFDLQEVGGLDGVDGGTLALEEMGPGEATTVEFEESFNNIPIVISQIQESDDNEVIVKASSVTDSYVDLYLCGVGEEENDCGDYDPQEVGWIAVDPQENPFASSFEAGTTSMRDSEWTSQSFSESFTGPPSVVATIQTNNGGQQHKPSMARGVTSSEMDIRYCEHDGGNICDTHAEEDVGWFAAQEGDIAAFRDSGVRVSSSLSLHEISEVESSEISWSASDPEGSQVTVEVAVTEDGEDEPQEWEGAVNGDSLPGVSEGDDLSGKYLWIRQTLTVGDESPAMQSLSVFVEGETFVGARADAQYNPEDAYKAFNHKNYEGYSAEMENVPAWIEVEFSSEERVTRYAVSAVSGGDFTVGSTPRAWELMGSNDGSSWSTIDTRYDEMDWMEGERREFLIEEADSYPFYRLNVLELNEEEEEESGEEEEENNNEEENGEENGEEEEKEKRTLSIGEIEMYEALTLKEETCSDWEDYHFIRGAECADGDLFIDDPWREGDRYGLYFDGENDFISIHEPLDIVPGSSSFTIEFWVNLENSGWDLPFEWPGGDRIYVGHNEGSGWNFVTTTDGDRSDTHEDSHIGDFDKKWAFVQAVQDREDDTITLRVYDKEDDLWEEASTSTSSGETNPSGNLYIPSHEGDFPLHGTLKEMRFFHKARSKEEAEMDMNDLLSENEEDLVGYWPMEENTGGVVYDKSINNNDGVIEGASWEFVQEGEGDFKGERISQPFSLDEIREVIRSSIEWDSTDPSGTSTNIYVALGEDPSEAPSVTEEESEWQEATSGNEIPGIEEGDSLMGKYLWIRQELSSEDEQETSLIHSINASVDGKEVAEYVTEGERTSREFDILGGLGTISDKRSQIFWTSEEPAGTSLEVEVRFCDQYCTDWERAENGGTLPVPEDDDDLLSLQLRTSFSTEDEYRTPRLEDINIFIY